jgi:D-serine deaminase-like pyridoxal phosphate-dependent protein
MEPNITRPTLIINEQISRANIKRMADKATASGVIFRPHFKTHQSIAVGKWFSEFGVSAITVSSLSMAEEFAYEGWDDITIAFPINLRELDKYNNLTDRTKLSLLIDSIEVITELSVGILNKTNIYIEIDCGYGRSGVHFLNREKIKQIIDALDQSENLTFKGFLTHSGDTYSADSITQIRRIYDHTIIELQSLKDQYIHTHPEIIISVGDTPSCSILDDLSGADEIRPGNFVYYDLMQYYIGSCELNDIAVSVACPVTGIYPERNEIVIYGGAIHLSKEYIDKDGKLFGLIVQYTPEGWSAPIPDTKLISISQEHGVIKTSPEFLKTLKHGDLLGILPIHSCLTANLLKDNTIVVKKKE